MLLAPSRIPNGKLGTPFTIATAEAGKAAVWINLDHRKFEPEARLKFG
jgi:hypothetical protein